MKERNFASDNNAGMSPMALKGFLEANGAHAPAYGDDAFTQHSKSVLRDWFECDCEISFVAGGTPANCLSIASSIRNYNSVICHKWAHIQNDECHAPGFFTPGVQLRPVEGVLGKVTPQRIAEVFELSHGVHGTLPGMVSITQSTEGGTNYTVEEIRALAEEAHRHELVVHMDGARFSNALVSTGASPAEMSWKAGVDILSLGGVKNGLAFGEALVVFNSERVDRLEYRVKQSGQLSSKMRYLSAPWASFIESGEWRRNAEQANAMAQYLAKGLEALEGVEICLPVESNAVFCSLPKAAYEAMLSKGWQFYPFPQMGGYRLMCSWDMEQSDIDLFLGDLASVVRS